MIIEITQPLINQYLAKPPSKRTELCDSITKGLLASFNGNVNANANSTGPAIWYLRHKNAKGTTAYQKLGTTMTLTVQGARLQAMILKEQIAKGIFPADKAGASDAKPEAGEITLHDFFFGPYLERAKQTKKSWIRDVQTFKHLDVGYGDTKLADITLAMVHKQRTEQMNSGLYSAATVNHSTKLWRQLTRQAAIEGLRPPLLGIKLLPVQNMVENYLDDQQLGKLLGVLATHENRTVSLIAQWLLATGSRSGETLKALHSDVDRERRLWKIPAANSKGKLAGSVFLNDSALTVLDQLKTKGRFEYLFINEKTGKPFTTITKSWERIRTIAGLPHFRIHDLRHQHAVLLINSGRTLFEVATALRHRDPNTTTIRYAHLTSKTMQDVSNCADVAIKRAMATANAAAMAAAPAVVA
jgi:integrase